MYCERDRVFIIGKDLCRKKGLGGCCCGGNVAFSFGSFARHCVLPRNCFLFADIIGYELLHSTTCSHRYTRAGLNRSEIFPYYKQTFDKLQEHNDQGQALHKFWYRGPIMITEVSNFLWKSNLIFVSLKQFFEGFK